METGSKSLIGRFEKECQDKSCRRIGLEIERVALWKDGAPFLYRDTTLSDGTLRPGAGKLLASIHAKYGWELVTGIGNQPIGMKNPDGKVSLEPGSQLEFSLNPKKSLIEIEKKFQEFECQVDSIIQPWKGLCFTGLGLNPLHRMEELDIIPHRRYQIMTEYLSRRGKLATTMMRRSTSVQINLDYSCEEEAIEMLRVALVVVPVSYALFGNSPILEGKETGFLSYRAEVWRNCDPDRSGLLAEAFDPDFSFAKYADYLWHRPLMFVQDTKGEYVPAEGFSLQDISEGRLSGVEVDDNNRFWAVQELFTEARLKPGYIEVRSVDGLLPEMRLAAAAFWTGLLYSKEARKAALQIFKGLNAVQRYDLWVESSKQGLRTEAHGISLSSAAETLVRAAEKELKNRGYGEEKYLGPLFKNISDKKNPADRVLEVFRGQWKGNVLEMLKGCRLSTEKKVGES